MFSHTSLSLWIDVAHTILTDAGYDADKILTAQGVAVGDAVGSDADRFDVKLIAEVWRELARLTNDPAIGLHAAEKYFQPASWQALGLSVLCSSSLHDAFQRLERYGVVISNAARFAVDVNEQGVALQIAPRLDSYVLGEEAVDFGAASIMKLFRMIYPGQLKPASVELFRKAESVEVFNDYFSCEVTFSTPSVFLRFSHEDAERALPMGNEELATYQDQLSEDYKKRFGDESLSLKVKDEMLRLLPGGEPTPKAVASNLCLSVRNLQRKLNGEGTSFSALLTEIRQNLAKEYLKQPYRSCNEIAYLLGFSDHSNFTRAFRRWFDQTPTQFREELGISG